MITVYENNILTYRKNIYKCSLGVNGLSKNKIEGDGCTPVGIFSIGKVYFRDDRINAIKSKKKLLPIRKNMYWSDDPTSSYYNKLIYKKIGSCEKLFRGDNLYNIVIVVNFNVRPVIKGKGSAIFLHIAKGNYQPTKGCIGLKKNNLIELLNNISLVEKIKITSRSYISA